MLTETRALRAAEMFPVSARRHGGLEPPSGASVPTWPSWAPIIVPLARRMTLGHGGSSADSDSGEGHVGATWTGVPAGPGAGIHRDGERRVGQAGERRRGRAGGLAAATDAPEPEVGGVVVAAGADARLGVGRGTSLENPMPAVDRAVVGVPPGRSGLANVGVAASANMDVVVVEPS
jgi:hypothetical protein